LIDKRVYGIYLTRIFFIFSKEKLLSISNEFNKKYGLHLNSFLSEKIKQFKEEEVLFKFCIKVTKLSKILVEFYFDAKLYPAH